MHDYQMGAIESRFADIIWENEPISSTELAKRSEKLLQWKKSTTYTVLKRLCDKGIFQNNQGTVTSLMTRQEFYSMQSQRFVEETFAGSLPAFLAAFTARKPLTPEEVAQLRRMVAEYPEES
ncbi:MAG TPA: BlaI/MecI/CopY family transcriptional regulator [Firmicutes bacterium]|nr:BlaI/MecI/CopY family transcriptional regulator [Bacillota bacterium]